MTLAEIVAGEPHGDMFRSVERPKPHGYRGHRGVRQLNPLWFQPGGRRDTGTESTLRLQRGGGSPPPPGN